MKLYIGNENDNSRDGFIDTSTEEDDDPDESSRGFLLKHKNKHISKKSGNINRHLVSFDNGCSVVS